MGRPKKEIQKITWSVKVTEEEKDYLRQCLRERKNVWLMLKDKTPSDNEEVLVLFDDFECISIRKFYNGIWYGTNEYGEEERESMKIVRWMPLPLPPVNKE